MPMTDEHLRDWAMEQVDLWNAHDVEGVVSRLSEDVVWSRPGLTVHGRSAAAKDMRETLAAFPDLRFDPAAVEVLRSSDATAVVYTWSATATMTGSLQGVPPTGKGGTLAGMTLSRMSGDLVAEYRIVYDGLEYLQLLGLVPPSDSVAFKALVVGDVVAGKAWQAIRQQLTRRRSAGSSA